MIQRYFDSKICLKLYSLFYFAPSISGSTDNIAPIVSCPVDQQATVVSGNTAFVNYPAASATDNSGGVVRLIYSRTTGSSFPTGTTIVTVTGTDPTGNIGQCTFRVIGKFHKAV